MIVVVVLAVCLYRVKNLLKHIAIKEVQFLFIGQEANPDTWKMAKMNMAIRGIDADLGPYNADTFTSDLHPTLNVNCGQTIMIWNYRRNL